MSSVGKVKVRIVFKDNEYMRSCGFDHTIECDHYFLSQDNSTLFVITDGIEAYYPLTSILFFEDLSKLIRR